MQRLRDLRRTHKKVWFGMWILTVAALLGAAQLRFDVTEPIRTQVLGASVKSTPAPSITSGPSGSVSSTSATFTYSDSEKGVTFLCGLDVAALASCPTAGKAYSGLTEGSHTFRVAAQGVSLSPSTTRTWTVDLTPPPAPTFSKTPEDPTFETKAQFNYRDTEAGVSFVCGLDGATPTVCAAAGIEFKNLAVGTHTFSVWAVDAAGNRSLSSVSWSWTILENKSFGISGSLSALLYPGVSRPLDLTLTNPYNFAITVQSLNVAVTSTSPSCPLVPDPARPSLRNLVVDHGLLTPVVIPANANRSLSDPTLGVASAQWPQITMPNLPLNQDGCKNASLKLSYTGTATKS